MDEVSHHALKGRWCNWYDNTRWSPDACTRQTHMWGAGLWRGWKRCGTTLTCDLCSHMTGGRRRYLQRGEGAGQGARWPHAPPLLLESSSQTLKLHLLLTHGRQERRGILTLLHTHWERRQSITHHTAAYALRKRVWHRLIHSCVFSAFQDTKHSPESKGKNENIPTGYYTQTSRTHNSPTGIRLQLSRAEQFVENI